MDRDAQRIVAFGLAAMFVLLGMGGMFWALGHTH